MRRWASSKRKLTTSTDVPATPGGSNWQVRQAGLPENWNLTYQLNAYQKKQTKRLTWDDALRSGRLSPNYDVFDGLAEGQGGKPFQSYNSVLCSARQILGRRRRRGGGRDDRRANEGDAHRRHRRGR